MKYLLLTITSMAFATAVFAQTTVEDTDGDGVFSMEELMVAFPSITDEIFAAIDTNEDGQVDVEELATAEAAGLLQAS